MRPYRLQRRDFPTKCHRSSGRSRVTKLKNKQENCVRPKFNLHPDDVKKWFDLRRYRPSNWGFFVISSCVVGFGARRTSLPDSIRNIKCNLMLPGKMLTVLLNDNLKPSRKTAISASSPFQATINHTRSSRSSFLFDIMKQIPRETSQEFSYKNRIMVILFQYEHSFSICNIIVNSTLHLLVRVNWKK